MACTKYFSLTDSSDAYEQVRVKPAHVERTAILTPDGNMLSLVMQRDCNAPTTFQTIMNHIFSSYIGRFMDVYLDDIIIYSNTLEEHMKHIKLIIDIFRKEKFYLGESKVHFLAKELKVLGHIVDHHGEETLCAQARNATASKTLITPTPNTTHTNPQVCGGF